MGQPARVIDISKKQGGFASVLQQTAKAKSATKSKTTMPELDASPEVRQAVDEYLDAKEREKIANADMDNFGGIIISFVEPVQDKDGYTGVFRSSYAVPGTKSNQVKFVSSDRYSINPEDSEEIKQLLGDKFDDMIELKYVVNLKPVVFEDKSLQEELMAMVGDRFGDFFDTTMSIKTKEDFGKLVYRVVDKDNLSSLKTFCRRYKPSLR